LKILFSILLIILISGTAYVFADSQIVTVSAGDSERLLFNLKEGDKIQFQIYVDGGRNDDVYFKLRNPTGGTMISGNIVEYYGNSFTAPEQGNYVFEFDNDRSFISSKKINFSYDIIKRPISQAITTTARDAAGGGCLIATATYGSEMSQQVQQLRELRDNQLLQTESGKQFMGTFNDIYYSFSPIIADYERENPYFKEAVKLAITPMISTLSLMENAESESEVLGIGISVIVLNLGMYLGVPAIVVVGIRKKF
jgi:hypothetical protein